MKQVSKLVATLALILMIVSCGAERNNQPKYLELMPGAQVVKENAIPSKGEVVVGQVYYVSALSLRVRSQDAVGDNTLGVLSRNDQVKVLDASEELQGDYIQVEVVMTRNSIRSSEVFFLSYKYLSPVEVKEPEYEHKYYVVQNVATEILRVYERTCRNKVCRNKMVLESEIVVGEDKDDVRTWLGSYNLLHWKKFYQDYAGNYPSWFHPDYPMPPKDGKGALTWLRMKYMPKVNGMKKGEMRGAFGWYTGFVGPNSNAQWTHGTIGWGESSIDMIKRTKRPVANFFTAPRSHGCSRTDNMTIAYLREILPPGTKFLKVYAIEKLMDEALVDYNKDEEKTWEWVLTKKDSQKIGGQTADREKVLATDVTEEDALQWGTYKLDTYPDVIEFQEKGEWSRKLGQKGNVYGTQKNEMKGVFYIDTGLFQDYQHPVHKSLTIGGIKGEVVPKFADFANLED